MFSGTQGSLLDGSWHHVAVSVSSAPGYPSFKVFVDGFLWEPHCAESSSFLRKGLSLGGKLIIGQLEVGSRGKSLLCTEAVGLPCGCSIETPYKMS